MRIRAIVIVIAAVGALPLLVLITLFGTRIEMGHSRIQIRRGKKNLGVVRVIGGGPLKGTISDRVGIWAFNEIYTSIGVTQETFARWETEHGMDSLGTGEGGQILAPGYPVFSKVAWMYVDPVTLSPAETEDLIKECDSAARNSADEAAKRELEAIRSLAERALSISAVVEFGHP